MAETPNKTLVLPKVPAFSNFLKGPLPKAPELRDLDRALADWFEKVQFAIRKQFNDLTRFEPALNAATATKTEDYSVQLLDGVILCDATNGELTVSLPPPARVANKLFIVKKVDASGNIVTVMPPVPSLIDGVGWIGIPTQWFTLRIISDGTSFYLV